jgi:hypothetical protein
VACYGYDRDTQQECAQCEMKRIAIEPKQSS